MNQADDECFDCCGWGEIHWDDSFGYPQASECPTCKGTGKRPKAIESTALPRE